MRPSTTDRAPIWVLDHADILGGGQLFALRLLRFLRAADAQRELVVVCPRESALAARAAELPVEVRAASFPDLRPSRLAAMPRALLGLRRVLAGAGQEAALIGNTARAQAYATLASPLARSPRFIHLMHEQESAGRHSARFVHRRYGTLAAIGANAAAEYTRRLPGVRVSKANNFLEPADLDRLIASRREPPRRPRPRLAVVGRLVPEKGVLELVDELSELTDSWSEALVAGDAQDRTYAAEIEARIDALGLGGRLRLLGHRDDVPELLAGADVLVLPSSGTEAQPTAILEALACGRPVVARATVWSSDFAGMPVVPYASVGELGRALEALPEAEVAREELIERFGPRQLLDALGLVV